MHNQDKWAFTVDKEEGFSVKEAYSQGQSHLWAEQGHGPPQISKYFFL
jgi:hypothetical protein